MYSNNDLLLHVKPFGAQGITVKSFKIESDLLQRNGPFEGFQRDSRIAVHPFR